jgi:hypothetical protein
MAEIWSWMAYVTHDQCRTKMVGSGDTFGGTIEESVSRLQLSTDLRLIFASGIDYEPLE